MMVQSYLMDRNKKYFEMREYWDTSKTTKIILQFISKRFQIYESKNAKV